MSLSILLNLVLPAAGIVLYLILLYVAVPPDLRPDLAIPLLAPFAHLGALLVLILSAWLGTCRVWRASDLFTCSPAD